MSDPVCGRCGRVIELDEQRVTPTWAPYAVFHNENTKGNCHARAVGNIINAHVPAPAPVIKKEIINRRIVVDNWPVFLALGALAAVVSFAAYALIMCMTTTDRMTGCYTNTSTQARNGESYHVVELRGNVDWHPDRELGTFNTFEEAVAAGQRINCPVQPDMP